MRQLMAMLVLVLVSLPVVSGELDEAFAAANALYENGQYAAAMSAYQDVEKQLAATGEQSPDLYHNMGCAAFRLDDPASARFWMEKARRLRPSDRDILHNLVVLKQSLADRVKEPPVGALEKLWSGATRILSFNVLAYLVLAFLLMTFFVAGLLISGRWSPKPLYYLLGVTITCLLLTGLMLNSRAGEMTRPEAVVFAEEVEIFSEPNTSSSLLFRLHAGTLVVVEDQHSGFVHVSLPDGLNGWGRRQDFRQLN